MDSVRASDHIDMGQYSKSQFKKYNSELLDVKRSIQEIKEINELVKKNDQLQKREVDHQKKLARDKETQEKYMKLKHTFSETREKLELMKERIQIEKNEGDLDDKEFNIISLNIQSAYVNLKAELEESHKIYGQYRQNFKDVLVRQFMNIDGGATQKAEVERLVEEDPNVDLIESH